MHQNSFFGQGSTPHPAGGAHDAPAEPLVGCGEGHPLPKPFLLDAFSVSISALLDSSASLNKIPGYPIPKITISETTA